MRWTTTSKKLRVLFDTTVFCGALVKPDGANMRCLLLANAGFFVPILSQSVLAEFVRQAVVKGLGSGARRRLYTFDEVERFLAVLSPILGHAQPVGLRDAYPAILRNPGATWREVAASVASTWPSSLPLTALNTSVRGTDPKDWHLVVATVEYSPDVIVTSNEKDVEFLKDICSVERPSIFLKRFDIE